MSKELVCQVNLINGESVTIKDMPLEDFINADTFVECASEGISTTNKTYVNKLIVKHILTKELAE